MHKIKIESVWRGTADCMHCGLRHLALFGDLEEADFHLVRAPIDDLHFKQDAALYGEGSPSKGRVHPAQRHGQAGARQPPTGASASCGCCARAMWSGWKRWPLRDYDSEAVALTDVSVCRIPLAVIQSLGPDSEHLHRGSR